MTTTSISVRSRATAAVVSLLLLVGAQILGAVPRAAAATPATISGTVVDAVSGLPLQDVSVVAAGSPAATTNASGSYTLSVPAGDHSLSATLDGYAPKTSAQLTVADGAVLTGVNFTLQKYATVHGVVENPAVGGVNGVRVALYDATTNDLNPTQSVVTSGSGTFEIANVVPGSYKVAYDASGVAFMTRWYDNASTRDLATVVTIAPGATVDLSTGLVAASSVSGKVVDELGAPVAGAQTWLLRDGLAVTASTTAADGTYTFGSIGAAGQYSVEAYATGYVTTYYGNVPHAVNADFFSVPDSSSVTVADIVLPRGGWISGTMDPSNVDFSYVTASQPSSPGYSGSVDTATGTYTISGLPSGTYDVTFHANGFVARTISGVSVTAGVITSGINATLTPAASGSGYSCTVTGKVVSLAGTGLPGVQVASAGTRFTSTAGDGSYSLAVSSLDQTLTYSLAGYVTQVTGSYCVDAATIIVHDDVRLSRIVTIKGTVSTSDGPLAAASVSVYAAPTGQIVATATTAADGTYSITNLDEGQYAVAAFKDVPGGQSLPPVFHGGGASLASASYLSAPEGFTASGVDMLLYKAGSITGTVTLSDNSPASGAQVSVWSKDFTKTVVAGADGTFTVGGLPAGTYTLSAYLTRWASVSQQVVLAEGEAASDKNLTLGNGVAVSGIVSTAGTPLAYATVYLRAADGRLDSVSANGVGEYVFRGVPQGTYTVGADTTSGSWWLGGVTTSAHAQTFTVDTAPVGNVDILVPTSHDLTVTVLLPGGTDHATSGSIVAYDSFGEYVATGSLSDLGVAALPLTPGTYTLSVHVDGYPTTTASAFVADAPGTATLTVSAGADLTVAPGSGSTAPSVAVVVRDVATGITTTGAGHLAGLAAGTYVVAYYPVGADGSYCGPLVWYGGGTSYLDAGRVTLAQLESRTLTVSATCAAAASTHMITGTVTVPAGVALTAGRIQLAITDAAGTVDDRTSIDATGAFSFSGLPAGTYTIQASDGDVALLDASVQVALSTDDAVVTVPMALGGTISGTVLDAFGHQVVTTVSVSGSGFSASQYTPTGRFALSGLPAGDYTLNLVPAAPYTAVALTPVHVALGATADVGTVTVQLGGRITGHLPAPADGSSYSVTVDATDSSGRVLASTTAQAGNDYALWGVPAGTAYVRFSGPGLVTTWWRAGSTLATATPVQVVANGAASGVDPTLVAVVVPTTTISGTVSGVDGPMAGVGVSAGSTAGAGGNATTGADGSYVLTVPEGATYTVTAGFCFGDAGELGCYGTYVQTSTSATVSSTPVTHVDLVFGSSSPAPFTAAPVPTITGDALVGSTLTAVPGTWTPSPDSTQLQWLANGLPVSGATASMLVLTPDLLGAQISVQVTAAKSGYATTSRTSAPTAAVQPGIITGSVAILGAASVGQTLTASGSWAPSDASASYTWLRDGLAVGTGDTYGVVPADAGHSLAVGAVVTATGYTTTAFTSSAVAVPVVAGSVGIAPSPSVGVASSAVLTGWATGSTYAYSWTVAGVEVSTADTYTPVVSDGGMQLVLTVTATKPGYGSATGSSSATVALGAITGGAASISGTPAVGSTLTASSGGWSPVGVSVTYAWSRDGQPLGVTGDTYVPTLSDVGHALSVTATAGATGYVSATVSSSPTGPVPPVAMTPGQVTVTGTPAVGSTLTASTTGWTPATATVTYQWLRSGAAVTGATAATYVLVNADAGATMSVRATATAPGYATTSVTSTPTAVVTGGVNVVVAGTVTISGTPYVTSALIAQPGTWSPTGVRFSYQWLRDGVAIPGANGQAYVVPLTDLGHTLSVSVTGTRFGYVSATAVSASTPAIQQQRVTAGTVMVTGAPYVLSTLTAQPGTWTPANARFAYQWLRDGTPIPGATDQTYVVATADLGHALSVSVTGTRFGYVPATAVSGPTAPVQQAHVVAGTVTISGTASVGSRLTARPGTWQPTNANLTFQWLRDGLPIVGATGGRYIVATADVGHALSVTVTGSRFGYLPATATSGATAVVPTAQVLAGTVAISGRAVQGSFLLAATGSWSSSVDLSYQWLRDGVAVTGARRFYYQVTQQDVGHVLTVVVTGSQTDYLPASVTSAPTPTVR